jgi:hypothetical protein
MNLPRLTSEGNFLGSEFCNGGTHGASRGRIFSMSIRAIRWIPAMAALLAISMALSAQDSKPSAAAQFAPADISGVWFSQYQPRDLKNPLGLGVMSSPSRLRPSGTGGFGFVDYSMEPPPMTPWAEERYKIVRAGTKDPYEKGNDAVDPFSNCLPPGIPRLYDRGYPFEIVQAPQRIVMIFEEGGHARTIYLDGRKHPTGAPPTFWGHSIGHWEGTTLVVETVGMTELTWLDGLGHPHSSALKVVEHIRRASPDRLEIDFLFDDPKAYTKPWKGKKVYLLHPEWEIMAGATCEDTLGESYAKKRDDALRKAGVKVE